MPPSKSRSRRSDSSRFGSVRRPSWIERIKAAQAVLPIALGTAFFLLTSVIIIAGGEAFPYRLGQTVSGSQIIARVPVPDPEKLRSLQEAEELATANHYVLNEAILTSVEAAVTNLLQKAKANETLASLQAELKNQKQDWVLDEKAFAALRKFATDEKEAVAFKQHMAAMVAAAKAEPLVRQLNQEDRARPSASQWTILKGHDPPEVSNVRLKYVSVSEQVAAVADTVVKSFPPALHAALSAKWREILRPPNKAAGEQRYYPIYEFDKKATDEAIRVAREGVSIERAAKPAGTPICEPGIITERDLEVLRLEHQAYQEALRRQSAIWSPSVLRAIGVIGIVLFVTSGLFVYVWWYGMSYLEDLRRTFAFVVLMLIVLLLVRLGALAGWPKELAVAAVVMVGATLTIAFDQRFAFGATSALAVLVTVAAGGGLGLLVVLMTAMGVGVFTLKQIRARSKVLNMGGLTAAAAFLAAGCTGLMEMQTFQYTGQLALTAASSGLAAGFIVFGMLPLIERAFDVTTALTLLEWGTIHQPLLRRLREEAPGTYSHSQTLGDMAEGAAEAIGADGLLARTGAYYHDVGKIVKPNYFVENYEMRLDQHKKLQPTMSMLIIVGHVRDGLELARQYGLPRALRRFIGEHHGTTLVEYFYHEAANRQVAEGKREPAEAEFRYPGPKPQSKETAILMLCDSVEGAVRAMSEPTAGRIESMVHQIAMKRLMDGQLDQCNMTLQELRQVEDALTRSLIAMYHGRISYPKGKPGEKDLKAKPAESAG